MHSPTALCQEDRDHPKVRKLTIFSVAQVKLRGPETHNSIARELHGEILIPLRHLQLFSKIYRGWATQQKAENKENLPSISIFKEGEKGKMVKCLTIYWKFRQKPSTNTVKFVNILKKASCWERENTDLSRTSHVQQIKFLLFKTRKSFLTGRNSRCYIFCF